MIRLGHIITRKNEKATQTMYGVYDDEYGGVSIKKDDDNKANWMGFTSVDAARKVLKKRYMFVSELIREY